MQLPALYYPYIHVRDEAWLKTAALFWPSVQRLVPAGYRKHDSGTARAFVDARVLRDEQPDLYFDHGYELLSGLRHNADALIQQFSVTEAYRQWEQRNPSSMHESGSPRALGWIHLTKFPHRTLQELIDLGLARYGRHITLGEIEPGDVDLGWSNGTDAFEWVGLHPTLAGAYMAVLANQVGRAGRFQPLTDQVDLRLTTQNDAVDAAIKLLAGPDPGAGTAPTAGDGVPTYVMLALEYVRPARMESIAAEKILQCRNELADELQQFRAYVEGQRAELADLAGIRVDQRRLDAFTDHVQTTVAQPLQRLEKSMAGLGLEPVRSLMLASSFAPPAAVGVLSHQPVVGAATGVAAAVGQAWWQTRRHRAQAKAASPVGYLLDVRDRLTPKTVTARVRKLLLGTYGRPGAHTRSGRT